MSGLSHVVGRRLHSNRCRGLLPLNFMHAVYLLDHPQLLVLGRLHHRHLITSRKRLDLFCFLGQSEDPSASSRSCRHVRHMLSRVLPLVVFGGALRYRWCFVYALVHLLVLLVLCDRMIVVPPAQASR